MLLASAQLGCSILAAWLQVSVTEQLLDRLEDVKRTFPTAVILGGAGAVPTSTYRVSRMLCRPVDAYLTRLWLQQLCHSWAAATL